MALDRWIALIILLICVAYGYTAFFTMDAGMPPFMRRSPIWPSTFPKSLAVLGIIISLSIVLGIEKSDVNIKESIAFHEKHNKLVTVTAVNPGSRFGELDISPSGSVNSFQEKPLDSTGRINGGFFVLKKEFIKLIDDDATVLEQTPMINAANKGEMMAFKHDGFWQCMDTKRDVDYLNNIWSSKEHKWNFIS